MKNQTEAEQYIAVNKYDKCKMSYLQIDTGWTRLNRTRLIRSYDLIRTFLLIIFAPLLSSYV